MNEQVHITPASRSILHPLHSLFVRAGATIAGQNWVDLWTEVFGVKANDTQLYGALALVDSACVRAVQQIEITAHITPALKRYSVTALDGCAVYLKPKVLHKPAANGKDHFSAINLQRIEVASELIEQRFSEPAFTKDQLKQLNDLLTKIESILDAGTLHVFLVKLIRPHIDMIKWAVMHYEIIGIDGLMRACTDAAVQLRRVDVTVDEVQPKAEASAVRTAFGDICKIVDTVDKTVRITERGYQLYGVAHKLLA